MANDPESQLYSDVADLREKVPKLEKELSVLTNNLPDMSEVKSLKTRIGKLTKRVDSLELLAFQDQITRLADEVKTINNKLLDVSRQFVFNEMETLNLHMQTQIDLNLEDEVLKAKLIEYISEEFTKGKERRLHTSEPLSVLSDFRKICTDCSQKYNIRAFKSKP